MKIGYLSEKEVRRRLGIDQVEQEVAELNFGKANASTVGGLHTAINALQDSVAGKASVAALATKADVSAIPLPADTNPPAVADTSAKGGMVRYAREDHTHASTLVSRRVQLTLNNGVGTWVFPIPYAQGVIPTVDVSAETPRNATYLNTASVIENSTTNTQVEVRIVRVSQTTTLPAVLTSLLGAVLNLFAAAPQGVWVSISARKQTA